MTNSNRRYGRVKTLMAPLALALVACGANVSSSNDHQSTAGDKPPQPYSKTQADRGLQSLVDAASADLRQRVGDTPITLLRASRVTWRSAALGCPQPDRATPRC